MRSLLLLFAGAAAAIAQPGSGVLFQQTFETDVGGWTALGQTAAVRVTHEAGQAHGGTGALAFTYEARPKQLAAAVLPAPPEFARMGRIRFWVKSDHDAPIAALLTERKPGGGNYTAWFWVARNVWQQIELTRADFAVSDGPNDPVDPDGKLDLDQVQGFGILDLGQFFAMLADTDAPIAVQPLSGPHTLLIDDLEVLSGNEGRDGNGLVIDHFDRGFLDWITPGRMDLKLSAAGNPLGISALQAAYEQRENQYEALLRRVSNYDLSKATRLTFDIASEHEATLLISLELKNPGSAQGPRFALPIYPPGGREVFHVNLKLEDFEGTGKLDASLLKSIAITDVTAAAGGAFGANTVWIGRVEAR